MPKLPAGNGPGAADPGGIAGYPLAQLYREVAFVAYHFHWSHAEIMEMEHADRQRWAAEISGINREMNEA